MSLKITPTDSIKETEGVWTKYMGVDLKVARGSNPKYLNELAKRSRAFQKRFEKNRASNAEMKEALCHAAARHLLVDWKGLSSNGESIPYSVENAYDLLISDIDCREAVLAFSDDMDNYMIEEVEETVGK